MELKKEETRIEESRVLGKELKAPYPGFTFTEFYEIYMSDTRSYKIFFLFLFISRRISNENCNKLLQLETSKIFGNFVLRCKINYRRIKSLEPFSSGVHIHGILRNSSFYFLFHRISIIYSPRTTIHETRKILNLIKKRDT